MRKDKRKQRQVHNDYYKRGCQMIVAMTLVMILILVAVTYTWYTLLQNRRVNSEERDVMTPYYLYLVDKNGTDSLNLTVGNLHPGETKQIVIGVTNQKPNGAGGSSYTIAKDSIFHYDLELTYTSNLPLNYTVYAENASATGADTRTISWTDKDNKEGEKIFQKITRNESLSSEMTTKNNTEMYQSNEVVNKGQYDIYDKNGDSDFQLKTTVDENGNVNFGLDYYLIELSWKDGIQFADYLKETDLMYVIVNAKQLEPKESQTSAVSGETAGTTP